MYDLVQVLDGLSEEISKNLKELSTCHDIDERKKRAEIIKMLCESLGIFFDGMGMVGTELMDEFYDDDDEFDDDVLDFTTLKKGKKSKTKKKDDNDIPF